MRSKDSRVEHDALTEHPQQDPLAGPDDRADQQERQQRGAGLPSDSGASRHESLGLCLRFRRKWLTA
ncbi:hypothetical protein ACWGH8_26730 [Nonomuraea muscovyensis]|uniref:Uncharacterized protein n=1 Tax=Nonomuraea muscovyensis TaxID=1124761 RepID=A0A7X0C737_9ACTN|nr:hypothetical protein [Nonomuraea muscovyensis]MBB6348675.1 hypothetical protein [Nonomuraea muscovyensis]